MVDKEERKEGSDRLYAKSAGGTMRAGKSILPDTWNKNLFGLLLCQLPFHRY